MDNTVVVRLRTQASCFSRDTDKFHGIGGAGVVNADAGGKVEGNVDAEAESWLGNTLELMVGGRFSFSSSSSSRTSSASASCSLMLALNVAL